MTRRPLIAPLLIFLALPFGGASAQNAVLRLVGDPLRSVEPGKVGTVMFRAVNPGRDTLDSQLEIDLPAGWSVLSRPAPSSIAPGASLNRLVAFHVPERALPELHSVGVALIRTGGDTLATASVVFRVKEHRSLRTTVLQGPPMAAANAPFSVRFAVMNDGNTHETVDIDATSSLGRSVRLDANRIRLAPFSAAEVIVEVEPASASAGRYPHTLRLDARAEDADGQSITSSVRTRTDLVPEGRDPSDVDPTIPVEVGIVASGSPSDIGRQVALSVPDVPLAGGRMQIGLRGPYMQQAGPFDQQDLYFATWERGSTRVSLGDQSFRQTRLTEYGTTGFGAGAAHTVGRVAVSAYAMQTRFRFPDRSQAGFSTSVLAGKGLRFGMNGLYRHEFADERLASIDGEWRLGRRSVLQAEYGVGEYAGRTGTGLRLELQHADRLRRVDLRYQDSSPDFPGSGRGMRIVSVSGSHDIGGAASIEAAYGRTRRAVDFGRFAPTVTGYSRVGGSLRLPSISGIGTTAALSANHRYRDDDLEELSRSETYARGSLSMTRSPITARMAVEQGSVHDLAGDAPFTRSDLMFLMHRGNTSLSGGWVWEKGPRLHYPRAAARNQWTLSADVRWSGRIRTEFDLYATSYRDRTIPGSVYVGGAVEFGLPYGHRLSLRARLVQTRAASSTLTDLYTGFAYSIPVTVPTRAPDSGVFGHVVLASDGKPARGVLVSLGGRAVLTDDDGRFRFSTAAEGSRLAVSPGADYADLVVMNPGALSLETGTGSPIEIALVRGAVVAGRIEIDRPARDLGVLAADVAGGARGGIVVVARDGLSERLAMSTTDGRFTLDGLPPGNWTLQAVPETLPRELAPVEDSVVVRLAAGEMTQSTLRFRPIMRDIRIVGSTSLSLSTDPAPIAEEAVLEPEPAGPTDSLPEAAAPRPVLASVPETTGPAAPAVSPTSAPEIEALAAAPEAAAGLPELPSLPRSAPNLPDGGWSFPWWLLLFLLLALAETRRRILRARHERQLAESFRTWPGPRSAGTPEADREAVSRRRARRSRSESGGESIS